MTPEQRRAYLAFVRAHHPDHGGDHAAFVEGLTALRRTASGVDADPSQVGRVHVVHRKRGLRRMLEILRSLRRPTPPPRVR